MMCLYMYMLLVIIEFEMYGVIFLNMVVMRFATPLTLSLLLLCSFFLRLFALVAQIHPHKHEHQAKEMSDIERLRKEYE